MIDKVTQREKRIAQHKQDSAQVLADLARLGFKVEWISDLFGKRIVYKDAIPVLLDWLPRIDNIDVKEEIISALAVRWAKPKAAKQLIEEFKKEENKRIRWPIANALEIVGDDSVFNEIVELVENVEYGKDREMLALALRNMKDPRAQDVLIGLLDDSFVIGHAIMALGKLKSIKAYPAIQKHVNHPKTWVRNEAKKALARIDKAKLSL
jgi:HEAT repeat protein